MAHESLENPEIARMMNDAFVNVKVTGRNGRMSTTSIWKSVRQ
jgi:uncharacterized protein YyaL (SSP411 family)